MYGLYGIEKNITNIYQLAAPFIGEAKIETLQDLKPSYIGFLKSNLPQFPIDEDNDLFVADPVRAQQLASGFSASKINDLDQEKMVGDLYSNEILQANIDLVTKSLATLESVNAEIYQLFRLVVHSLLLCGSNENSESRKAHGGTTSKCIGLIWLNLKPDLSQHNVLEMLVHELTHTLVFLDELNHSHFNYDNLTKREFWATSSILKRLRPMDKVVHSILVSLELLHARSTFLKTTETDLLHPDSKTLAANTRLAIDSVLHHPRVDEVCNPRAIELVEIARVQLRNFL